VTFGNLKRINVSNVAFFYGSFPSLCLLETNMNAMTELNNLHFASLTSHQIDARYDQIRVEYDSETRSLWNFITPIGSTCFNLGVLNDLRRHDAEFEKNNGQVKIGDIMMPVDYYIAASGVEAVFNYGGDLALFVQLIKSRDRDALLHYASLCVDCVFARVKSYNTSTLTISLVQGDALGGGFETVLASNVIIMEEQARMGCPEILFNLFPGMGAYSLLSRRVGPKLAEDIILGGKLYTANELHEIGIVDIVTPKGTGTRAVTDYIRKHDKRLNGMRATYACRQLASPITHAEMINITQVWVDAALRLTDKDLKMMGRIVMSQLKYQQLRKKGLPVADNVANPAEVE
jgi:DSF synthase